MGPSVSPALLGALVTAFSALLLFAVGAGFAGIAWKARGDIRRSARWLQVQATVLESTIREVFSVDSQGRPARTYQAVVVYGYVHDGVQHTGDRIDFGRQVGFGAPSVATRRAQRFPAGSSIEVYVDPSNPAESVIERRSQSGMIFMTLAGFIAALGVLLLMISVAIWVSG